MPMSKTKYILTPAVSPVLIRSSYLYLSPNRSDTGEVHGLQMELGLDGSATDTGAALREDLCLTGDETTWRDDTRMGNKLVHLREGASWESAGLANKRDSSLDFLNYGQRHGLQYCYQKNPIQP